jgi:formiminotetrahydrofolate cyclodeaminase
MAEAPSGADEPGLARYLEAVASAAPTPGGGSVAAVVAALAAALGAMVANLTIGRTGSGEGETEVRLALGRLEEARRALLALAMDDERAYGGYLAAASLPRTPEMTAARQVAMQTALVQSAAVPLNVAAACLTLLPDLHRLAEIGNRHLLSDVEVAAILTEAAVHAALVNVRVNARLIRDRAAQTELLSRAAAIESQGASGTAAVRAAVAGRSR